MSIGRFAQVGADGGVRAICMTDIADAFVADGYHDEVNDIRFIAAPEGVSDVEIMESYRHDTLKWVNVGKRPSLMHKWSAVDGKWVGDMVAATAAKRLYISAARLKANQSSFTFQGKQVAVDILSRGDIDGTNGVITLTNELPENWLGGWKTMDNTYVTIADVSTWVLFYKAMVGQGIVNFAHSQALKTQLAAATTIQEVEAIVW